MNLVPLAVAAYYLCPVALVAAISFVLARHWLKAHDLWRAAWSLYFIGGICGGAALAIVCVTGFNGIFAAHPVLYAVAMAGGCGAGSLALLPLVAWRAQGKNFTVAR